jgi:hypothetical protein
MMAGPGTDQQMAVGGRRGAGADSQLEVSNQVQTCPKCGSVARYTQRRVS